MERRTKKHVPSSSDRRQQDRRVIPRFSNSEFLSSLKLFDLFFKIYIPFVLCVGAFELAYGIRLKGQGVTRGAFFAVLCFTLAAMGRKAHRVLRSYLETESIAKLILFQRSLGLMLLGFLAIGGIIYLFTAIFRF